MRPTRERIHSKVQTHWLGRGGRNGLKGGGVWGETGLRFDREPTRTVVPIQVI